MIDEDNNLDDSIMDFTFLSNISIIGIKGVPPKWSLIHVVKAVAKYVAGPFEPLNFTMKNGNKTCYLRLSKTLDPLKVAESITSGLGRQGFIAYIPEYIPKVSIQRSV